MGKVVKGIAAIGLIVGGILLAPVTGGVSIGGSFALLAGGAAGALIATGLTLGMSLLRGTPKAPKPSPETIERLNASVNPRTPRKMVVGITAMNTDIRDHEYTDSQTYLHRFIVVAAHKVNEITEIWFDDKKAWTLAGGVQGDFVGYLTVAPILEGSAGNAINISARMGTSRRYTGCAYVHLRYKLTGNSKKTESPFAQSIPSRITIVGEGALVYDPRLDSTVEGGSGSHRADDQSTWEWDDDAARNPALQLLWYMLGWRINDLLSVGKGIPPARIDLESFITAANLCDETVSLAVGGNEPRYRSDGVFSEGDNPTQVLDNFKATMNADLDDVGGKIRVTVFHNDLGSPIAHFDDHDMIEGFNWDQTPALDQTFNIVRGTYTDPSDNSLYQQVDYPEVSLDSPDGIDRIDPFDLAMVQSASQAQRLAKQRLQRQQYAGEFSTTFGARGWLLAKNVVITMSFARLGWVEKLFRVAEMEHRVDGTCPVILVEENEDIYAWDEDEAPAVEAADPTTYDFTLNPFFQESEAISEASKATALATSFTEGLSGNITQANAGSDVTVTIPNHDRIYQAPYGRVAVTGGAITGLAYSTTYLFYYDDPDLAGGAVTIGHTTVAADGYFSDTHPYRHSLGYVLTMSSGGTGGNAGGSGPPGSGGWGTGGGNPIP